MSSITDSLDEMLKPIVVSMGFEFVGIEYVSHEKGTILRIYIDHENGIEVDNCADVSRQISALLDVEDPISGEYTLEVSSPGIDRPLFTQEHYQRFIGHEVKLTLLRALSDSNQKRYRGTIHAVLEDNNAVTIELALEEKSNERDTVVIPFELIKKANLTVQF